MAALGAGHRCDRGLRRRRDLRALRRGPRRRCAVGRPADGRMGGLQPGLRAVLLGPAAGLPVRGRDRLSADRKRRRRHPAGLVAAGAGGGFSRGAGRGDRGRAGQPALRPRGNDAECGHHRRRIRHRAHRRRRAQRRHRHRGSLHRHGVPAQGALYRAGHPGTGGRGLSRGAAGDALHGRHEDRHSGRDRLPQGPDRRRLLLARRRLSERHGLSRTGQGSSPAVSSGTGSRPGALRPSS